MELNDIQVAEIKRSLSTFEQEDDYDPESVLEFNQRSFSIARCSQGYHAFELSPTGVLFIGGEEGNGSNYDNRYADAIRENYRKDPNGFAPFIEEHNIDPETICRSGGGYSVGTIYHDELSEAIDVIISAIKNNHVVRDFKTSEEMNEGKTELDKKLERYKSLESSLSYWKSSIMPESDSPKLLSDKETMFGSKIPDEYRNKILSYLNAPSLSGWEDIRGVLITRSRTIWQMMTRVDPSTPSSGDGFSESCIPTPALLEEVLVKAISIHNQDCDAKIKEILADMESLQLQIDEMQEAKSS